MGIDISLQTRKSDQACGGRLSRRFCNFVCGPDAFENNEFSQIEDILDIDLEPFRRIPDQPDFFGLECEIALAEEEQDWSKAAELKTAYQNRQEEWIHGIYGSNESWTKIADLRSLVRVFLDKIYADPDYHLKLKYNLNWGDYFLLVREDSNDYDVYPKEWQELFKATNNTLIEDLRTILAYLDCVEAKGHQLVGFQYG